MKTEFQKSKFKIRILFYNGLCFSIILLFFAVTLSYGEEREELETETIVGKTMGKVMSVDHNLQIIEIQDPRREKDKFPIEGDTNIWIQVNLESIDVGDEVIIDYNLTSDGLKVPLNIYINKKKVNEKTVEPEIPEEIEIKKDDEKTEDYKNKDFFEGVDTTKMNYDMDLGVTDDGKK